MSQYIFPTNLGTRFQYGRWDIGIYLSDDLGVGRVFALGYSDPSTGGFVVVKVIDGPYQDNAWNAIMTAAGGMGNYIVGKQPVIDAALQQYFNPNPPIPNMDNSTPFTPLVFNQALRKYLGMEKSPAGDWPRTKVL